MYVKANRRNDNTDEYITTLFVIQLSITRNVRAAIIPRCIQSRIYIPKSMFFFLNQSICFSMFISKI